MTETNYRVPIFYSSLSIQSPCYNRKTKSDCPNRSITCRQSCEEWKAFEEAKQEHYKLKKQVSKKNRPINSYEVQEALKHHKNRRRCSGKKILRK